MEKVLSSTRSCTYEMDVSVYFQPCVMEVGIPAEYVPAAKRTDTMLDSKTSKSPAKVCVGEVQAPCPGVPLTPDGGHAAREVS